MSSLVSTKYVVSELRIKALIEQHFYGSISVVHFSSHTLEKQLH